MANEKAPKESSQKICQEKLEESTADCGTEATGSVTNKSQCGLEEWQSNFEFSADSWDEKGKGKEEIFGH